MLTDTYLEERAKDLNSETGLVPNYLATSTTVITSVNSTDTTLDGEVGSRISISNSRSGNVVTLSGIRSGAVVIDGTNGDNIGGSGMFNTGTISTSDKLLQGIAISGVTQTTNFDIEFVNKITITRR